MTLVDLYINPATKKVEGDYGEKYKGSVSEKESMITPENGFVLIETLEPGVSPLSVICLLWQYLGC